MIKLTSYELNTLVHDYLESEGYSKSLEAFKGEASDISKVNYGLADLVQYGMEHIYAKRHGPGIKCGSTFCLSEMHTCQDLEYVGYMPELGRWPYSSGTRETVREGLESPDDSAFLYSSEEDRPLLRAGLIQKSSSSNGWDLGSEEPSTDDEGALLERTGVGSDAGQETKCNKDPPSLGVEKSGAQSNFSESNTDQVTFAGDFFSDRSGAVYEFPQCMSFSTCASLTGRGVITRPYSLECDVITLTEHVAHTGLCKWNSAGLLATASSDGQLRLFKGRCVLQKDMGYGISALDFKDDRIVCGNANGDVSCIDMQSGRVVRLMDLGERVNVIKIEDQVTVCGSSSGCVSVDSNVYQCSTGNVCDVEFLGTRIAVASQDGAIRVVSPDPYAVRPVNPRASVRRLPVLVFGHGSARRTSTQGYYTDLLGHERAVNSMAHYRNCLVSASNDSTVKIWDMKRMFATRTFWHDDRVLLVRVRGERIYSSGSDGALRVWDFERQVNMLRHGTEISTFDKKSLVVTGSADNTVKIWDERVGEVMRHKCRGPVRSVSLSDDERLVGICCENEFPVVLDLRST